ncbi:hypothetical protein ACWHLZ_40955 [Streptomyces chartreusis]
MNAPDEGWTHGTNSWHGVVIVVTITLIVTACAGLSADWVGAAAALLIAAAAPSRR